MPTRTTDNVFPTQLPTTRASDLDRNLRAQEKASRREYSLTKLVKELCSPGYPSGLEAEADQELARIAGSRRSLTEGSVLIPSSVLSRDLASTPASLGGATIQTWLPTTLPISFLRAKTICGKLGCTVIDGLSAGSWALPRSVGGTTASWQLETGTVAAADMSFDQVPLVPSRISSSIIVSSLLTKQSSPDLEKLVVSDMSAAIATAVDAAAINGTGTAPQPRGIMAYPVNASGAFAYGSRSANVTFGGAATWPKVLAFELALEQGLITNDGSFGWAVDPTTRDRWQQAAKVATYPSFLWENMPGDSTFGYVNGRRAISSTQLAAGQVIFGKWSELILGSWLGIELTVDPFSRAASSEILITTNLLCGITLRYALAFCASSDSGAQ
jgi:hypothetical protein